MRYLLFILIFTFSANLSSIAQKDKTSSEAYNSKSDSILATGWYYLTDQKTNYKRQLDKTSIHYFIDPNMIVSVKQFNKLEIIEGEYKEGKYPILIIRFDKKGKKRWSTATEKYVGGRLGLIINDKLVYAPIVNSPINGGISNLDRPDYTIENIEQILEQIKNE